jgi:hypothetical protein
MCYKAEEHIKHIVTLRITLAPSDYNNRHNKVDGYFHWMICKHMRLQISTMNNYLKGHKWPQYHDYMESAGYDRLNDTSKLT